MVSIRSRLGFFVSFAVLLAGLVSCSKSDSPDAVTPIDYGPGQIDQQTLFEGGSDGYSFVRIPALVTSRSGTLLAFAEGRHSLNDDGDIDIVLRRSVDMGATWSDLAVAVDMGSDTVGNPTPIVMAGSDRIWLPFCSNPGTDANTRSVWLTYSDDDGKTWVTPRDITAQAKPADWTWYATGPGRGIETTQGRLVIPADHVDGFGVRRSHVIFSDDAGETWTVGGSAAPDTDEAQVVELSDGRLMLNMRYEGDVRARAIAISSDAGATWGETTFDNQLPDPGCEGSILAIPQGLLFSNPATTVAFPRDHVTVRWSQDNGATWAFSRLLDEGPSAYSSLTRLPDGRMGIVWESGSAVPYDRVQFARFDLQWLRDGTR